MTPAQFSVFFASLSLLCWVAVVVVIALAVIRRRSADIGFEALYEDIAGWSLWLAWIVATVTTLGSLYYSLIAHYTPCELCWYQRICVYPLSAILLIAALRKDRGIWRYVLPQVVVGIGIAAYHTQLQAFPKQVTFCSTTNPCTVRWVWQFGFVSLPFMDLAALAFIVTMLAIAPTVRDPEPAETDDESVEFEGANR